VRREVVAAVGDGGGEVRHLQRYDKVLAFADRDGVDVRKLPRSSVVGAIVIGNAWHQPTLLVGEVDAQGLSETEASHVLRPFSQPDTGIVIRIVGVTLVEHPSQYLVEVWIARV